MKQNDRSIDDILERSLPSAPQTQMDAGLSRVLNRLRSDRGDVETQVPLADVEDPRGFRWRWVPAMAAAAAVLVAVWVGISWNAGRVTDALATAEGSLYRISNGTSVAVRAGDRIGANEIVRSNGGAGAMLALADGSRIELRSRSELWLEQAADGVRIHLNDGGVIVNAAEQRAGHLYVQTKDVTVSVVGTVFVVNASEQGSRVAVIEGEVRVQQGATEQQLRPGEQITTEPSRPSPPVTDAIAWSRNAQVLRALLQQSTVVAPALSPQVAPRDAFEAISIRPTTIPAGSAGRGGGGGGGGRRNQRGNNPCSNAGEPVVDPRRFDAVNGTALQLVSWAYGLDCWMNRGPDLLFGGPEWIRKDGFDVQATIPEGLPVQTKQQLHRHEALMLQRMLQRLLADRFSLVTHREMRELPVYVLTVAKGGPKFTRVNGPSRDVDRDGKPLEGPPDPAKPGSRGSRLPPADQLIPELSIWQEGDSRDLMMLGPSEIHGRKRTIADLVSSLWLFTGRPVLDRTGLSGYFNYFLQFAVVECPTCPFTAPGPDARREPGSGPPPTQSLFSHLEQVGLELKPSREQVEVLVIDRVERPTEN